MGAEHWRPRGLSQGYYCMRCGDPVAMYSPSHGAGKCIADPELVKQLNELNTVEAEDRRKFMRSLKYGR